MYMCARLLIRGGVLRYLRFEPHMTFADITSSQASALGNFGRFVTAKAVVESGQVGVDFANAFTANNAWAVTASAPVSFVSANREQPT